MTMAMAHQTASTKRVTQNPKQNQMKAAKSGTREEPMEVDEETNASASQEPTPSTPKANGKQNTNSN